MSWTRVCPSADVALDRGVAAMVAGHPVAVFRLSGVDGAAEEWHCIDHVDPVSLAPVMARGLVGSIGVAPLVVPTVASPIHKERYNLHSGVCLDDASGRVSVHSVRVDEGDVWVQLCEELTPQPLPR